MRARGRRVAWQEVQENNKLKYPDPALPTYEDCTEYVEGEYETRHVSVPFAGIDYQKHTIDGHDVDPDTIEFLP
jgi:hypothetical protein